MKSFPYYQRIWWDALCDYRRQLAMDCSALEPDKLRFQTDCLFANLMRHIEASPKARLKTLGVCYSFVTDQSLLLGYDEPRRLHLEELDAVGIVRGENGKSKRDRNKKGSAVNQLLPSAFKQLL